MPKRDPDLVAAYMLEASQSGCELFNHLEGRMWEVTRRNFGVWPKACASDFNLECHHIFGGPHRWDITPNIIGVSRVAHDYCTSKRYSNNGKVCCLWVKAEKDELDLDLMRECFGFDPLGRMESWHLTEEWAEDMRRDLLGRFGYG